MSGYKSTMQELMRQYEAAWERVNREEEVAGAASEEAERLLMTIELEIEMLQNAV